MVKAVKKSRSSKKRGSVVKAVKKSRRSKKRRSVITKEFIIKVKVPVGWPDDRKAEMLRRLRKLCSDTDSDLEMEFMH